MLNLLYKCVRFVKPFLLQESGGVTIYAAFFSVLAVGAGALALDFGRMGVLRTQMQNRADAGAMAGAAQLDGRAGAQTRAAAVASNAMSQYSAIPGDASELSVQSIGFFKEWEPSPVAATGDEDSKYLEVVLNPRRVDFYMEPLLNSSAATHAKTMNARAVAASNPFICHAPPLMVCDPGEDNPADDLSLTANIGRQLLIKPAPSGGTAWAPGNYGLLALPDGSLGASDISGALASVQPADCYNIDVTTATGVKTNKVQNGVNARFDLPGGLPYPAPNVISYPMDAEVAAGTAVMGSGTWALDAYWTAKHGGMVPAELASATRYQVYLYELGLEFGRSGSQTIHPVEGALPAGYTLVTPPPAEIPTDASNPNNPAFDGVPELNLPVAANGQARRLVQVAVIQCVAENVGGSHTYPTNGNFLELFLTQAVPDEPAGGIYGEIVKPLSPANDPDFHANVELVE